MTQKCDSCKQDKVIETHLCKDCTDDFEEETFNKGWEAGKEYQEEDNPNN